MNCSSLPLLTCSICETSSCPVPPVLLCLTVRLSCRSMQPASAKSEQLDFYMRLNREVPAGRGALLQSSRFRCQSSLRRSQATRVGMHDAPSRHSTMALVAIRKKRRLLIREAASWTMASVLVGTSSIATPCTSCTSMPDPGNTSPVCLIFAHLRVRTSALHFTFAG